MKIRHILLFVSVFAAGIFSQVNRKMEHDGVKENASIINPEQDKSCLIVHSEITNLRVTSNNQIIDIDKKSSSDYWVWLAPGTHVLKFDADGFMTLTFGPNTFARKRTYEMTIRATGFGAMARADENLIEITFSLNEDSVYISWSNDFAPNLNLKTTAVYKLPVGTYNFSFRKNGFKELKKSVELKETTREEITLVAGGSRGQEAPLPGLVVITSEPDTAEILINGQRVGTTRFQGEVMPGENQLEIRKPYYFPDLSTFKVETQKYITINKKLKSRAAYVSVTGTIPKSKVFLNGKAVGMAPLVKHKVESGNYEVRVTSEFYHDFTEKFALNEGEEKSITADLKAAFGGLQVSTSPENGADVYLDGERVGVTPFQNTRVASGRYFLKVVKSLYNTIEEQIEIIDGQTLRRDITMETAFSELTVSAPGCSILVNGRYVAMNNFKHKVDPGKYSIKAEKDFRYIPEERDVVLGNRSVETLALDPQPRLGILTVFAEPADAQDAEIFIENEKKGNAPLVIQHIIGEYTITAKKTNYLDFKQKFSLAENEKKRIDIKMMTYAGSRMDLSDKWGKAKWWSLGIGTAGAAAMGYFYYAKNSSFDKYKTATTTADAVNYHSKTKLNENLFRAALSVSAAGFSAGVLSFIIQTVYRL